METKCWLHACGFSEVSVDLKLCKGSTSESEDDPSGMRNGNVCLALRQVKMCPGRRLQNRKS